MQWLRDNWFWIGVAILFVWMHAKMHGGHGHHAPVRARGEERPAGHPPCHGHTDKEGSHVEH